MQDKALIRSILERVNQGETTIDVTPKTGEGLDARSAEEFKETMEMLDSRGLLRIKHKHLGGKWDIDGLTNEGKAYLKDMQEEG